MNRLFEALGQWIRRVISQPQEELDRWQRAVRFAHDLGRFGARQLQHDRAQQMAAALAFRTLFGLLPVLVVATVLVKAMGLQDRYLEPLGDLFAFWGLDNIRILAPGGIPDGASMTLSLWLQDRVREAERFNVTAVGWVGVAITIYAAISLLVTIENCCNVIYRASHGRAWTSRIPLYWSALTLSPVVIFGSTYVDRHFERFLAAVQAQGWLASLAGFLWSLFALWLIMFCLYLLFPSTRVRLRPAMVGALVAAVLLEVGKRTLGIYLQNALSISQLYGSLGLIPLFMFWVYLMWLAVLFGLQVSSTLQYLRGRQLAEIESRQGEFAIVDPAMIAIVMRHVGQCFVEGRSTTVDEMATATDLPPGVVDRIAERLLGGGWIHRLAEPEGGISLSRPPETIPLRELLAVGHALAEREVGDGASAQLVELLRSAQQEAAGHQHLGTLLAPPVEAV